MTELSAKQRAWSIDQLAKSEFFHMKLHDWNVFEIGKKIERVKGEKLDWNLESLEISEEAWKKVIHRGIRPVLAFAHPEVLGEVHYALAYYRMLSMVSQKSMRNVGLNPDAYEQAGNQALPGLPDRTTALAFARHLNKIVSRLIEADDVAEAREFDLWRGMAAGTQAQGSWQNNKGKAAETVIRNSVDNRLQNKGLIDTETVSDSAHIVMLKDGRRVEFHDDPDIAIYRNSLVLAAVEVKGGIDPAGVLERIGAALKSLSRAKQENVNAVTVMILQAVSVTPQAEADLESHLSTIDAWYTAEDIVDSEEIEEEFFRRLGI